MGSEEKKGKREDKKESMNKASKHQKPMKSLGSSQSFKGVAEVDVGLVPISSVEENGKCEEKVQQSLLLVELEEVECDEDLCSNGSSSSLGQKKRRLSVDQVKALEKDFEVENKLDPERKVRLAQELGLLPRQIAVWFQNRRARWKTKQLERDFDALRARHDALKLNVDALRGDKEALMAEVRELKAKVADSAVAKIEENNIVEEEGRALVFKDGTSDSDSSVVFNGDGRTFSEVLLEQQCPLGAKSHCTSFLFECLGVQHEKSYLEEGFLGGEELCGSIFSQEQAPSLSWCCTEGWQ